MGSRRCAWLALLALFALLGLGVTACSSVGGESPEPVRTQQARRGASQRGEPQRGAPRRGAPRRAGAWRGERRPGQSARADAGVAAVGSHEGMALPAQVRVDRLVVHKGLQRMEAYRGEVLLKSYRVQLGSIDGPKRWEGDWRTPEGDYRIDGRFVSKAFHRFMHVSYPNAADRQRYAALKRGGEVPEGAGVGSAIGIHGEPTGAAGQAASLLGVNWTAGCIAVNNSEIEELYRAVVPGARLVIQP